MNDLQRVDELILENAKERWQKVAFIVARVLIDGGEELAELYDSDVAERVKLLVSSGRLKSRGDLNHIGYSEICLP